MIKRLRSLFVVDKSLYPNELDRRRANGLIRLVLMTMTLLGLFWLAVILTGGQDALPFYQRSLGQTVSLVAIPIVALIVWAAKTGRLWLARWTYVMALTVGIGSMIINGFFGANSLLLAIPLIAAGGLLGRRVPLMVAFLALFVIFGAISQSQGTTVLTDPAARWQADLVIAFFVLIVGALHLVTFNTLTTQVAQDALIKSEALDRINRFFASRQIEDEQNLYAEMISFLRELMNVSFVQIFYRGDDGRLSRRIRGNLGIRSVSVQIDGVTMADGSPMMRAIALKEPVRVSRDDSTASDGHLLTATRTAVLVPILYEGDAMGVIDVQNDRAQPLSQLQLEVLTTFAEIAGTQIVHERLVAALRQNITQQEEIIGTLRERLQELRSAQGVGGSSWRDYLQQRRQDVIGFDFEPGAGNFVAVSDLPDHLQPVIESGALQISTEGDAKIINVPIVLADEVLGAMSFSVPKTRTLTERQIETAQIVANRLALALENKRLFEQIQSRVSREVKATQAANLLITATDVESVMNVAVANFSEAMGAIATRIHLQPAAVAPLQEKEVVL